MWLLGESSAASSERAEYSRFEYLENIEKFVERGWFQKSLQGLEC